MTKMKFCIIPLILLTLFLSSCATIRYGANASPEMLEYSEIITIDSKSHNELYIRANEWFVDNFASAESVIQFQDKEDGKLLGKYVITVTDQLVTYAIKSTVAIDVKEGKVRIEFRDPYWRQVDTNDYELLVKKRGAEIMNPKWREFAASFKNYMQEDNEW